jgi:hypothetical protein
VRCIITTPAASPNHIAHCARSHNFFNFSSAQPPPLQTTSSVYTSLVTLSEHDAQPILPLERVLHLWCQPRCSGNERNHVALQPKCRGDEQCHIAFQRSDSSAERHFFPCLYDCPILQRSSSPVEWHISLYFYYWTFSLHYTICRLKRCSPSYRKASGIVAHRRPPAASISVWFT